MQRRRGFTAPHDSPEVAVDNFRHDVSNGCFSLAAKSSRKKPAKKIKRFPKEKR
jgi:hypothetical protein